MIGEPPHANLKIGFVARKDIAYGEELFFDYGLKSHPDFPWIALMRKKLLQHSKNYIQQEQGNTATCLCTV